MNVNANDYSLLNYNIQDSIGQFTYKVKLSDHIDYDPKTGYLYCLDAIVGNIGVQTYKGSELGFADGNRIVKVHRVEEHIFAEDSLESLRGKPITLNHPTEMVDSNNFRKYAMGTILDVGKRDGDNIVCDLVIHDKKLIDKIAPEDENSERHISDEFRDLSLGYSAKLLPFQDTDEYVQTDIQYNHLAVVKEGRASNAIIRDSHNPEIEEKKPMNIFKALGKVFHIKDNQTVEILDEELNKEQVVLVTEITEKHEYIDPYEHDQKVTVERTTTEVVKKDDGEDAKIEEPEKGEKKMEKDKAYFDQAFKDAKMLPDGAYKDDVIKQLNDEYLEAFPRKVDVKDTKAEESVTKKIVVVDSKEITKDFQDQEPQKVDFMAMENESKVYYDKISNPESKYHKNHQAFLDFFNSEVKSGQSNLNM